VIDHIVYGVPDLMAGVDELERRLGVRAVPGGKHPGRGTHNALLGLGDGRYAELIARDPDQVDVDPASLPFGLDRLRQARLIGWVVAAPDIEGRVSAARARGLDPGDIVPRSRRQPDGTLLHWRMTEHDPGLWLLPSLIDWGRSPHPSQTAPSGIRLVDLRAEHPDPATVRWRLAALGAEVTVDEGREPALIGVLDTPRGRVTLR
jgi:hypothetical protein